MEILKKILWALGTPAVFIWFVINWFTVKSRSAKYQKYPEDFLEDEKYNVIYKLAKPTNYLLRLKMQNILKDKQLLKKNQLIVANHRSFVDVLILFNFLYEQLGPNFVFIAKQELANSKIAHILKLIDTIFIDRNNLRQMVSSIETQKKYMKEKNKSIVIFPEGTRNIQKELLEFKSGAFEIAYKMMCPIQPILFLNTEDYWEDKKTSKSQNQRPIQFKVMAPYQANKFLQVDRTIFVKNLQKQMQICIDEMLNEERLVENNKKNM